MNLRETADGAVTVDVLVQPRASRTKIGPVHDGRLKIAVTAPPVDGEANAAVVEALAKALGVPKSAVEVIGGATSRRKTVRISGVVRAVIAALALGACTGETGTVSVSLSGAPGSTLLDSVQTLRVEITNPPEILTAERSGDGFSLAIDLPASESAGALLVDGLDAGGSVIATGASPPFAFSATNGHVVIYMAPPFSVGVAPEALDPPRSELGTGALPYGALFAGGRGASGASDALEVYNAYDHSLLPGLPLPAPRAGLAVGVGTLAVYMLGGTDEANTARDQLWRFDPSQRPNGQFLIIGDKPGFARAGETLEPIGDEQFLATGDPAAEIHGLDGSVAARDDVETLPATAATVVASDGILTNVFVGATSISRFRSGHFEAAEPAGRTGATAVALPGGRVAVVCGTTDAIVIDAATGAGTTTPDTPSVAKTACAAAATSRHLLIAGGTTASGVDGSVEIYDATTLAPVTTATLAVPRTGAVAVALPNDQILIAGGVDAAGAPIATLELFTPGR
jgi:uncharacterized protein (TIGR00251 family)